MTALDPGLAPVEVAARLRAQEQPGRALELARIDPVRPRKLAQRGDVGAHRLHARERRFLALRAGPLHEAVAAVVTGVPGAAVHANASTGAVAVEVVADERRPHAVVPGAHAIEQRLVKRRPEVRTLRGVAEPAAVVAVGAGRDQRYEVAPFGALAHFLQEPLGLHARLLGVR